MILFVDDDPKDPVHANLQKDAKVVRKYPMPDFSPQLNGLGGVD